MEKIKPINFSIKFYDLESFNNIKETADQMGISLTDLIKSVIYDTVNSHPENMRKENKGLNIKE